jgi:hypothetical protein
MTDSNQPAGPWTMVSRLDDGERRAGTPSLTAAIKYLYEGDEHLQLSPVAILDATGAEILTGPQLQSALAAYEFGRWPHWVAEHRPDLTDALTSPATPTPTAPPTPSPSPDAVAGPAPGPATMTTTSITVEVGPLRAGDTFSARLSGHETRYEVFAVPGGGLAYRTQPPAP